ncbi:MAG TPA: hypothetical protein VFB27_14860 [Opitutaceae bacterium]|nr:hypothetical protein [Opitutaceae bacterium]
MKLRALSILLPLLASITVSALPAGAGNAAKGDAKSAAAPSIPGSVVTRTNGGFLSLSIDENNNFRMLFFDAKRKPAAPDVASATLHWTPLGKKEIVFVSLTPGGDGMSLASPRFIQKPFSFKLYVSLFAQGSKDAVENYIVDFSQ